MLENNYQMSDQDVFLFGEGSAKLKDLLGGKGAGLAEMTNIGLPVPPGFTITTNVCREYMREGEKVLDRISNQIAEKMEILEKKTDKRFGDASNPLLVSVRSGAPVSMPGMMDTVLNLGLNDQTVKGLIKQTGNEWFAYDVYRRFVQMYGKVVMRVGGQKFEDSINEFKLGLGVKLDTELNLKSLRDMVQQFKHIVKEDTGEEFPDDPKKQLRMAIKAVFESWNGKRARTYRKISKISDSMGTAVNVQVMVFGNMGYESGSGVGFTRNPSTGEKHLYGEYLLNAQGEDVVSGSRTPQPIDKLEEDLPQIHEDLQKFARVLEKHYQDMQDIEFTIESGMLYILQTRTGKRTAQAAVKIAVDMVQEGLITKEEALLRIEPDQLKQLLHKRIDPKAEVNVIAKGLPASPGAASGRIVFNTDEAAELGEVGERVILVRPETTPEDIHGMVASQGVLTSRGGMTCHAAVVARGMGKPAIVGAEELKIDLVKEIFYVNDVKVEKGMMITIDGGSGQVILGEVPTIEPELTSDFKNLMKWADEARRLGVRANADTPEAAKNARDFGAGGIGLCRTERMFNAKDRLPIVQEMILAETLEDRRFYLKRLVPMQKCDFKEIFRIMDDLPVTIRLLDLPLHEFLPKIEDLIIETTTLRLTGKNDKELKKKERILKKVQALTEYNPMIGHRGCRVGISYPEIYEMQTRAIFEALVELIDENVSPTLEIMLPLVSEVNELKYLRERIEKYANEVIEESGKAIKFSIGTMIETPRAALTADEIAEHADFFSFGTNDLTQTVWGYSRDDAEAKFLHDYLEKKILIQNPFETIDRKGVGKIMKTCVDLGRKTNKKLKIGICGEVGGDPPTVEFCDEIGLDYVSCSPFRVPIASLAAAQAQLKKKK